MYFGLKIIFTFTNSVDPAFHLGLHCLQKYSFGGFLIPRIQPGLKYLINDPIFILYITRSIFLKKIIDKVYNEYVIKGQ